MTNYFRKYKSLYSSTTNTFSTGTGVTITPNSVTGLPTGTELVLTFDRVDSTGTATPSAMERIRGSISGGNFVVSERGVDGTTEQAHTSPVVEMIWNAKDWNDAIDGFLVEHTQTGAHGTLSDVCMISPRVSTAIMDTNRNELFKFTATTSAVNEFTVVNAATGGEPTLCASGGDTKVALGMAGKGAFIKAMGLYDCGTVGATETVDWSNGDRQKLTLDENLTITFSNAVAGQTLTLYLLQDGSGTNTITWADTIVWQDGITWGTSYYTTTANKLNIAVIFYDGSAYYGMISKFA